MPNPTPSIADLVAELRLQACGQELLLRAATALTTLEEERVASMNTIAAERARAEAAELRAERAEVALRRLTDAIQDFMHAYRRRYARTIGGIRSNAPLRDEAKALGQALTTTEKETGA